MSAFNTEVISHISPEQVIDNHIAVQAAAKDTGYNIQYLRQLLRAGKLKAVKIGQVWLIDLVSLETYIANRIASGDCRCGPINFFAP